MAANARLSHRGVNSGAGMLDVLADDILRLESMCESDSSDHIALEEIETSISGFDSNAVQSVSVKSSGQTTGASVASVGSSERFHSFTEEETNEFLRENRNKNTLYKTRGDVKLFTEWLRVNDEFRDLQDISATELDSLLARFYLGIRKKDDSEYEPDTLTSIQNSIDRHIKDLKLNICIKTDANFNHSRRVLEAKRKNLKSKGKGNKTKRADALTTEELHILHEKNILGSGNPESLLNSVWMNNGIYFGLRGRQDHTNLMWGDIQLKVTSEGKEFLEFNERSTKTRSGAKSGDYRRVSPKIFGIPGHPNCPVQVYKEYKSHRPEDLNSNDARFYLRPLVNPPTPIWYSHQPIGKEKLGKMMNVIAEKGGLTGRKVNHSTRKTFATTLIQAGHPPTEVAHLGGWKNIQTINEYSVPSLAQQESASSDISNVIIPYQEPSSSCTKEVVKSKTKAIASSTYRSEMEAIDNHMLSMFQGATITGGTINISIVPSKKRRVEEGQQEQEISSQEM